MPTKSPGPASRDFGAACRFLARVAARCGAGCAGFFAADFFPAGFLPADFFAADLVADGFLAADLALDDARGRLAFLVFAIIHSEVSIGGFGEPSVLVHV